MRPIGDWKSWEECKFAVVVRLKDLMPQLINLNCYDTFILGDFKLTPTSILITPKGEVQLNQSEYILYEYDPSATSLREAVDDAIQQLDGWSIRMLDDEEEDILRDAIHEGQNINTKSFFSPLLTAKPYLSVGLRFDEEDGEHYRMFFNEMTTINVINYFFQFFGESNVVWPPEQLLNEVNFLNKNFNIWKISLEGFEMELHGSEALQKLTKNVDIVTNIAHLEVYLNKQYSRTLRGIDQSTQQELIMRWTSLDALKHYFDENIESLGCLK